MSTPERSPSFQRSCSPNLRGLHGDIFRFEGCGNVQPCSNMFLCLYFARGPGDSNRRRRAVVGCAAGTNQIVCVWQPRAQHKSIHCSFGARAKFFQCYQVGIGEARRCSRLGNGMIGNNQAHKADGETYSGRESHLLVSVYRASSLKCNAWVNGVFTCAERIELKQLGACGLRQMSPTASEGAVLKSVQGAFALRRFARSLPRRRLRLAVTPRKRPVGVEPSTPRRRPADPCRASQALRLTSVHAAWRAAG